MTIVEGVGWVLLHFVWQGAIIALALAILLVLVGERQARLRYALSCAALTLMLAATLATAVTLLTGSDGASVLLPRPGAGTSPFRSTAAEAAAVPSAAAPAPAAGAGSTSPLRVPLVERASRGLLLLNAAMPWLVAVWIGGVLLLSLRLLGGWWRTRALRAVDVAPVPDWCHARLSMLSERLRVTRPVAIVSSMRISVPVIVGHLKPVIVLPAAALAGLSTAHLEAIIAHELAHVRRHDYLVNLAQTVIETLLFYHPAVWWVSAQVRVAREHCCDDLAVTVCRSRHEYVRALLDLEELRDATPALALGATDGSLLARGRRLLVPQPGRTSPPRLAACVIALMVVAAAAAGASFNVAVVPATPEAETTAFEPAPAVSSQTAPRADGTSVVVSPDTTGALANRWAWAVGMARTARHRTYWIGYSISPVKTLPAFVYHDRSTTIVSGDMTFSGRIQSSNLKGLTVPGRPLAVPPGQNLGVKLMFELDASRGEPTLASVHLSTLSLPVETNDLPVLWLGPADAAQSLDRIDQFYRATADPEARHDLVAAAGVHDDSPRVVAWLERRIASSDPDELRGNAAEWIAYHPIRASVTALDRTARQDRSSHVRQEAAEALGDLALPEAATTLVALARTLSDHDARREAIEALGARAEPEVTDALVSIARQDKDHDIQREAVETLGDFEDKRGTTALLELAKSHPDLEIRREAIETLGDVLPADTAVTQLSTFLAEREPAILEEAVEAIAAIENGGGRATLMELARSHSSVDVRREAVEALGESDAPARETADFLKRLALADKSPDVQSEAIETLADLRDGAGIAALIELAREHPLPELRKDALERLMDSDHPEARALFERALKKGSDR